MGDFVKNIMYTKLKYHQPAYNLFRHFEKYGNLYLIGGVLREYKDSGSFQNLRDIDLVLNVHDEDSCKKELQKYSPKRNRFGGYKIDCGGLILDLWFIEDTWAYREHVVECSADEYNMNLAKTVFLNLDSIVYDWKNETWQDETYRKAMESRVLDTVLEKNPEIPLNILRSLILKQRYQMEYSEKLKNIIGEQNSRIENLAEYLDEMQRKRYGKRMVSYEYIVRELSVL